MLLALLEKPSHKGSRMPGYSNRMKRDGHKEQQEREGALATHGRTNILKKAEVQQQPHRLLVEGSVAE
jgi:hypothetical protein